MHSLALLLASIRIGCSHASDGSYLNVYGETLQPCSQSGAALTGYLRDGHCVDRDGDSGSHHICIDLSSVSSTGNYQGQNFCQVTGQSDWCSSTDMPCHDEDDSSSEEEECPVENWCVCQWAFASYINKAGGCDAIQDVVCDAINSRALEAYYTNRDKYAAALSCLVERCGLVESSAYYSSLLAAGSGGGGGVGSGAVAIGLGVATALAAFAGVVAAYFLLLSRKRGGKVEEVDRRWKGDDLTADMTSGGIS